MWPFNRKPKSKPVVKFVETSQINFSQLDMTERFGGSESLGPDEWIATTPLNDLVPDPERSGLPHCGATADEVYLIASHLSAIRESLPLANDGVYCPVCHIANTDRRRIRTPCPKCGRELLQFGWD
jgi:hypothetical protein